MAFSYGFYNSINEDRLYNAIQVSKIFDGIIQDGIYMHIGEQFIVKASTEPNTVLVSPGRAWFNHTWNLNDSITPIVGDPPELILDRIDALVIDVWARDDVRENSLKWVVGTPSNNPEQPALIQDNDNFHWQYPLAYVRRRAMTNTIAQADITNMVGSTDCPFVTAPLEKMDINALLLQWQDQWAQFVEDYEDTATTWRETQQNILLNYFAEFQTQLAEYKEEFMNSVETFETNFQQRVTAFEDAFEERVTTFEDSSEEEFNTWFAGIKSTFTGDVAVNLTNGLNALIETEFNHYYELINSSTVIDNETGIITTTTSEAISTTEFGKQGDNDMITVTIVPNSGSWNYIRTTIIQSTEESDTVQTNYAKVLKGGTE